MIKVIIVDDQVVLRESLKFMVEQDQDIRVIGLAGNGREAFGICKDLNPDIVLMDIMMPECNGVEGTKLIKSSYPYTKVIILTTFKDEENIQKAIENGADSYVLKDIKPDELILTIKILYKGMSVIPYDSFKSHKSANSKEMSNDSIDNTTNSNEESLHHVEAISKKASDIGLTPRELEVVRLIVDGKNNREISESLFISEGSVKNVISIILDKVKVKDRTQLAVFAVKNNLA